MTDPTLINPILGVPKEDRKVITVDVLEKDWTLLKGCDLAHGSLSATFNILLIALANECRKRGILDFSKTNEYRELVQSVGFIPRDSVVVTREELDTLREQSTDYQRILAGAGGRLRDSTPKRTARKSDGRNVGRRTKAKGDQDTTTTNATGLQSGGGGGDKASEGQAIGGETGTSGS